MKVHAQEFSQADYDYTIYQASVVYNEVEIGIGVYTEDADLDRIAEQVNAVVEKLAVLDAAAHQIMVDDLYESYKTQTVEEFNQSIQLVSLYFVTESEVEFTYDGGDLMNGQFLVLLLIDGEFNGSIVIDE